MSAEEFVKQRYPKVIAGHYYPAMTEDKTTITDNEVIARFYGNVVIKEKALLPEYREQIQIRMPDGSLNEYTLHALPAFHLRWEILMPVWYKFRDLKFRSDEDSAEHYNWCQGASIAILHKGPSPAEACKLLAEGIRWYNSVKK